MDGPFRVTRSGDLEAQMTEVEARAIQGVAADVLRALDDPEAPALRRLFPPAYPDDPDRQSEFASYTRDELLAQKRAAARRVVGSLEAASTKRGRVTALLDLETVHAWLGTINDARLALGTRLDVTEEMDHVPRPPSDPDGHAFNLYLYLGGIEEILVEYLMGHDVGSS